MKSIIGNIVTPNGVKFGIVEFDAGVITKVKFLDIDPSTVSYPPTSVYIFPGFVDVAATCFDDMTHEHDYREDYESFGMAALNGGVVQILELPNKYKSVSDELSFNGQVRLSSNCPIGIFPSCGIGERTKPPFRNVQYVLNLNGQGDLSISSDLHRILRPYNGYEVAFYFGARNPKDEVLNALTILDIVRKNNIRAKMTVSTVAALKEVNAAKESGLSVKSEVLMHNLYFDVMMVKPEYKPYLTFDYPIRDPNDRAGLLESLNSGEIDYLASYHFPCLTNEKIAGVLNGPQLDSFGGFLCYLMECRNIDPVQILKCACENPGALVGKFSGRKMGKIEKGFEASFTILDSSSTQDRPMQSKAGWSVFDSRCLPGLAIEVYVRGTRMVSGERVGALT